MSYVMIGSASLTVISGFMGSSSAKAQAREAAARRAQLQAKLDGLEKSRQAITDPYAAIKDVSAMAKDLSSMISNPFANLGVATKAAEFEAQQIDMSLANTLDTLKETGASAGGATALANAALKSKQGVSANIEQQEAQNEKLKAQGEQEMQKIKMAEGQRIQGVQMSEAQRVQNAKAQGGAFVFNATEDRQNQQINRVAGQLDNAAMAEGQANANATSAMTGMIGGLASIVGSAAKAGLGTSVSGATDTAGGFTASGAGIDTTNSAFQSPISDQFNNASTTNAWDDYQNLNIGNNRVN